MPSCLSLTLTARPERRTGRRRVRPGKPPGYSCSNGWHGCLGIPDMTITLGRVRFNAHPPGSIVMTGQWIASWIARRALAAAGVRELLSAEARPAPSYPGAQAGSVQAGHAR